MRDEEQVRHSMPVLGRMIILVAVIAAIPAAMWAVAVFVRTSMGPPEIPSGRPMQSARVSVSADPRATAVLDNPRQASSPALPAAVDAKAVAATDAAGNAQSAAPTGVDAPAAGAVPDAGSTGTAPAPATAAAVTPSDRAGSPNPEMTGFASPMPPPAASAVGNGSPQMGARQPSSADRPGPGPINWPPSPLAVPADEATVAKPAAAPIPLPRQRPDPVVLAETAIPLPQPRPDTAGSGEPPAPAGPADWLRGIFRSSSPAGPELQPVHPGNY